MRFKKNINLVPVLQNYFSFVPFLTTTCELGLLLSYLKRRTSLKMPLQKWENHILSSIVFGLGKRCYPRLPKNITKNWDLLSFINNNYQEFCHALPVYLGFRLPDLNYFKYKKQQFLSKQLLVPKHFLTKLREANFKSRYLDWN